MEAPSYPEYVDAGLRAIRPTLRLSWNPRSVIDKPGSYDATGHSRAPTYGGRFELWDTDSEMVDYMVMIVRNPGGSFRSPGQWLVDLMQSINPERFNGSVEKLFEFLHANAEKQLLLNEQDAQNLDDAVARSWADYAQRLVVPSAGIPGAA